MKSLKTFVANYWVAIVLAVVPPIAIWYFLQRDARELELTLQADVPVVSVQKQYAEGLALTYRANPINSLHVVDIEVRNSGNKPLERADYDTPLSFIFSGSVLSLPTVVTTDPINIAVELGVFDKSTVRLTPLLLNSGDRFTFRTFIVDRKPIGEAVSVNGRIKGVRELKIASGQETKRTFNFLLGILAGLLGAMSASATGFLALRMSRLLRLSQSLRQTIARAQTLKDEPTDSRRTSELAKQLDIAAHGHKSNILLFRLKIESQLRELSNLLQLPDRLRLGPVGRLVHVLEDQKIIPHQVAAAIRDLYPTLNRALHEAQSYISSEEFNALQRLSLRVVSDLENLLTKVHHKNKEK